MSTRSLCALIVLCSAAATSFAAQGPRPLGEDEMDAVTAGSSPSAAIAAISVAIGDFAFTQTAGVAQTSASAPINNNPASVGYVAVSAGIATATAIGNGASTGTSVTPAASVPGSDVQTYTINHHIAAGGTETRVGAVVKFGSYAPSMVQALLK